MLKIRVRFLVFYIYVLSVSICCIYKASTTCNSEDSLQEEFSYFEHNIVPPYEGDYPWNFDSQVNRNFSAINFVLFRVESSWIDVLLILDLFFPNKLKRFFVEAGGADGELFGNTIYLEKFKSWNGTLIEADPFYFEELLNKRRRVYAIKVCLSSYNASYSARFQHEGVPTKKLGKMGKNLNKGNGRVLYHEKGHSGFGVDSKDYRGQERFGEVFIVSCYPFLAVMEKLNVKKVDVLFLDVEGQELSILKTIPFQKICIHVIVAEYDGRNDYLKQMVEFLDNIGYQLHNTYHSQYTIGDALFVQRGSYSKVAMEKITDRQIKKILFDGTDSELKINDMPDLRNTIIN